MLEEAEGIPLSRQILLRVDQIEPDVGVPEMLPGPPGEGGGHHPGRRQQGAAHQGGGEDPSLAVRRWVLPEDDNQPGQAQNGTYRSDLQFGPRV